MEKVERVPHMTLIPCVAVAGVTPKWENSWAGETKIAFIWQLGLQDEEPFRDCWMTESVVFAKTLDDFTK
jgi:hypothetical protein